MNINKKTKHKLFYLLLIIITLTIVCLATTLYIRQLNKTISDNIISSISEIAEHDKAAIQTYIEICWDDLYEIQERFVSSDCKTIQDITTRLNLECASSDFTHIYLVTEDGVIYTDKCVTYIPGDTDLNKNMDFLPYFANGEEKVVARFDDKIEDEQLTKECILYGIRLQNYEVAGERMLALVGISDISSIQDKMVIDSFVRNGKSRGRSALIDMNGDYIVNINQNQTNNIFEHLKESKDSELTNEEVAQKLKNMETFGFYHTHIGEKNQELFYLIPFGDGMNLYFAMSVNDAVFTEQTRTFVTMSMLLLAISIFTVITMLLVVMRMQNKTMRASEREKSQREFLSNMSHEIRTPLNGLIGMNHLIMVHIDDDSQKAQIKEWLKKSHSTANYLLSLVNNILDMSKLQAAKVNIVNKPLLVSALIDEVVAMQTDNIQSRGVEFAVDQDIIEPCIEGDATRIKQILMNILGNAAKFTPKGNSIHFSVSQKKTDDTHVTTIYRCEDTGIGISKEYINKIFDPFSQERDRNTDGVKGTGLGMAISKLLANAMDGDITVESEINSGSTFTVTIPNAIVKDIPDYLKQSETKDMPGDNEPNMEQEDTRPVKVLIAEDVELNAEVLLEILAMEGFETVHAHNGQEAVELFRQSAVGEFGIILMDMQMPVMDGCTASREIRKLDRPDAKTVLIYACTANTFQEDKDMAMESGMNDFLAKPIDVNVLLKKMGNAVKKQET
ncbi:MAG: response regulator [Acetatifactor sp.]|nr:response regulator [Acetatifactor sp.]